MIFQSSSSHSKMLFIPTGAGSPAVTRRRVRKKYEVSTVLLNYPSFSYLHLPDTWYRRSEYCGSRESSCTLPPAVSKWLTHVVLSCPDRAAERECGRGTRDISKMHFSSRRMETVSPSLLLGADVDLYIPTKLDGGLLLFKSTLQRE